MYYSVGAEPSETEPQICSSFLFSYLLIMGLSSTILSVEGPSVQIVGY